MFFEVACAIIPLRNFDLCFCGKDVNYMDVEKEEIKKRIIEFINGIERLDVLEYIYRFITIKFKAGN